MSIPVSPVPRTITRRPATCARFLYSTEWNARFLSDDEELAPTCSMPEIEGTEGTTCRPVHITTDATCMLSVSSSEISTSNYDKKTGDERTGTSLSVVIDLDVLDDMSTVWMSRHPHHAMPQLDSVPEAKVGHIGLEVLTILLPTNGPGQQRVSSRNSEIAAAHLQSQMVRVLQRQSKV